jgi:hypothetical protein
MNAPVQTLSTCVSLHGAAQRSEQRLGPVAASAAGVARGRRRDQVGSLETVKAERRRQAEPGGRPQRANPDAAPETYAEFLYRASGLLHHEPSARARARAAR